MSNPTISIGFTTFNAEATISAAIQSALNQSYPATQIIVVDDASTDATLDLLLSYHSKDPRFLVLQNSLNSGVAVSRNRIIEHASGEFLAFFDDDDISDPRRLELQLQRILRYEREYANGAPVLCHTAREQHFPDGRSQIEPAMGHQADSRAPAGIDVARYALMGEPIDGGYGACATCSQMARTTTYLNLGGFDVNLRRCEDFDFAIRLAQIGGHFPGMASPLVRQQMTPTSDKSLVLLEKYTLMVFQKHRQLFDSEVHYNSCSEWLRFKYSVLSGNKSTALLQLIRTFSINPLQCLLRFKRSLRHSYRNKQFAKFIQATSIQ